MNDGDQDEAATQFEQAVAADPHSAVLRERLAAIYVRQGKLADALEQCQAAVVIDPERRREPADARRRALDAWAATTRRSASTRRSSRLEPEPRAGAPAARRPLRQARRHRPRHGDAPVPHRSGRQLVSRPLLPRARLRGGAGLQARRAGVPDRAAHQPAVGAGADRPRAALRSHPAPRRGDPALRAGPEGQSPPQQHPAPARRALRAPAQVRRRPGAVPRAAEGRHRRAGHAHQDRPHPARDRRVRPRRQRVQPGARRRSRQRPGALLPRLGLRTERQHRSRHRGVPAHPARPRVVRRFATRHRDHLISSAAISTRRSTTIEEARKQKPDDEESDRRPGGALPRGGPPARGDRADGGAWSRRTRTTTATTSRSARSTTRARTRRSRSSTCSAPSSSTPTTRRR